MCFYVIFLDSIIISFVCYCWGILIWFYFGDKSDDKGYVWCVDDVEVIDD